MFRKNISASKSKTSKYDDEAGSKQSSLDSSFILAFSLDYSSPMKKEPMYSYEKSVDFI
jgi:hypothetical protein